MRAFAVLVLVASLAGCDSVDEFIIGGTYSGVTQDDGTTRTTLSVDIPETASGSGTVRLAGSVVERGPFDEVIGGFDGTVTYDHPEIVLTLEAASFQGTVSDDGTEIELTVSGNAFATLARE